MQLHRPFIQVCIHFFPHFFYFLWLNNHKPSLMPSRDRAMTEDRAREIRTLLKTLFVLCVWESVKVKSQQFAVISEMENE